MTVRAVEDIPFERVRLSKSTQEEKKTAVDVATALAMGDKSAAATRCPLRSWPTTACATMEAPWQQCGIQGHPRLFRLLQVHCLLFDML